MMEKNMAEKIKEIQMPEDMQKRIIRNCCMKSEEKRMNKGCQFLKKPMVAIASLVVCLCLMSVTVLAATGKLQGFFEDVKRWDGAVIGTSYEQATDEIEVRLAGVAEELTLVISMLEPKAAPYSSFEMFGVENYKLIDRNENVIAEGKDAKMAEVVNGKVAIYIPLDGIENGEYKLIINEMTGSSKADQPLVLSGIWEIPFTK